jgi:hypothetical protein
MVIPKIKIEISDVEFNARSIAELLYNDFTNNSLPFRNRIYHAFPQLAETIKLGMTNSEIFDVVKTMICEEYKKSADEMKERKKIYSRSYKSFYIN